MQLFNLIVKCKPDILQATSYLIAELQRRKYSGTMCSASNEVPNPEKRQVVVAMRNIVDLLPTRRIKLQFPCIIENGLCVSELTSII